VLGSCKLVNSYCQHLQRCLPFCSEYWTGLKVCSGKRRWSWRWLVFSTPEKQLSSTLYPYVNDEFVNNTDFY